VFVSVIITMEFYQYQPQCSPLSTSSQTSSTSSSDDELGLKGLVQGVYAPYLTAELERLFVAEVSYFFVAFTYCYVAVSVSYLVEVSTSCRPGVSVT